MAFRPVISSNSNKANLGQINDMVRSLNKEQQVKTFNGTSGKPAVTIGKYEAGKYGMSFYDNNGVLLSRSTPYTDYKYTATGVNYYQAGLLPDGTYGIIITKPGIDIADVY